MTLYIDNIRLYKRPIEYSDWLKMRPVSPSDREWLDEMLDEDLLSLCSRLPDMKFIIFTGCEDTPLDDSICIPDNVLAIHAASSLFFNEKIIPFPLGIQRQMRLGCNNHDILQRMIKEDSLAKRMLYVNVNYGTGNRGNVYPVFREKGWPTVSERVGYEEYLRGMKDHKFVLCPAGNGIDCHRNWETLYLRRVPVLEKNPFLELLFEGFPCLFVEDLFRLEESSLIENEQLYYDVLKIDFDKLNLEKIFHKKTELLYRGRYEKI
jgi:hypothetical protein